MFRIRFSDRVRARLFTVLMTVSVFAAILAGGADSKW
jgi:hypothetical protein